MLAASVVLAGSVMAGGATSAAARGTSPGGCPNGFMLHQAHTPHDHGDHQVAGTLRDANGDGQLCVKHVGAGGRIHVHIDNNAAR